MDVKWLIKNNIVFLDGAMGTMLQKAGLKLGENPEVLNITSPQIVENIYEQYLKAGSNIIATNTFGANRHKLSGCGYSVDTIITAAVKSAKKIAVKYNGFVGLDIGPIGELLEPMGTLKFEEAYELFKEQVICGAKNGADIIMIETMTDLYEAKAAVLAAKENCDLPVFCTMSFEQDMRTFTGCSLSAMALTLEGLGCDAIGINCSLGPVEIYPMVKELIKWTNLPIIIKPNAGLPEIIDGQTSYSITPEQFIEQMKLITELGVNIIGGCCGTTPEYIKGLKQNIRQDLFIKRKIINPCAVCSNTKTVEIDRVRIIGERINPTGKKIFQQALKDNNLDYIVKQAITQAQGGADILDVNVGMPNIDEVSMMKEVIKKIQGVVSLPLQIDSSNADAIEAGLRIYNGKAIVNSVNGEQKVMQRIFPIVKKYGASVVGLTLDENGIPAKAEDRLAIAEKILRFALEYGIPKENLYIDCLTLTSSAEQANAYETIKAVRMVKEKLGLKTVLGVSNISFGLPAREQLNQTFLTLAMANGLDLPIINPNIKSMVDSIYCYHQLKNIDKGSYEYINHFSNNSDNKDKSSNVSQLTDQHYNDIGYCIANGLKNETIACCKQLLKNTDPLNIVSDILIPALDKVGKNYETGKIFLPQLIQSAEAAKGAFEVIREYVSKSSSGQTQSSGKIIIATVKGDIHDIGKNIVKVVLENYGYDVIDLGRDVSIETIVSEAKKQSIKLVGLSALMTTTLKSMEQTINAIHKEGLTCKIMVGGAVLTESYAKQIGADYYAKDAQASVNIARKVFEK